MNRPKTRGGRALTSAQSSLLSRACPVLSHAIASCHKQEASSPLATDGTIAMVGAGKDTHNVRESTLASKMQSLHLTTDPTTAIDKVESRHPDVFPWSRLPRELRNKIYSLLGVRLPLHSYCILRSPRFSLSPSPTTSLLLVSKQFHSEYCAELELYADTLTVCPPSGGRRLPLPPCVDDLLRSKCIETLVLNFNDRHLDDARVAGAGDKSEGTPSKLLSRLKTYIVHSQHATNFDAARTILCNVKSMVANLVLKLPQLRCVKVRYYPGVDMHTFLASDPPREMSKILITNYVPKVGDDDNDDSITVQTEVLLQDVLYTPHRLKEGWTIARGHGNWIEYLGLVSTSPYSYCGMQLEVLGCGKFTEKDLIDSKSGPEEAGILCRRTSPLERSTLRAGKD